MPRNSIVQQFLDVEAQVNDEDKEEFHYESQGIIGNKFTRKIASLILPLTLMVRQFCVMRG
jgi:hypothetical protein